MSEHEQVAAVRSIYQAFDRGDIPYILEQLDPDVEWHTNKSVPFSNGFHRGRDEVAQFFAGIAEYIADPSVETHEFIAAEDRVIVLLSFRGRGVRTDASFEAAEAHVWKLATGKVVEHKAYADTATIVQALQPTHAAA